MAMGVVSDKDFEKELINSSVPTTVDAVVNPIVRPGRNSGDNNVPDSLRKIIGETSEIDGRSDALDLASRFGISASSVSAYSNGSRSTDTMNKQPALNHINQAKERISKRARIKLFKALDNITDDKLIDAKAIDLASVARSLSAVVKDMEPEVARDSNEGKNQPTFIIYSPQIREERHYDVINARDL